MKTWLEENLLYEKLRSSAYSTFLKWLASTDPIYVFACMSAYRALPKFDEEDDLIKYTQKQIDDNNHLNRKNSEFLANQLNKNNFVFQEIIGHYCEEDSQGDVEERSFLIRAPLSKKDKLESVVIELAKAFNQYSVMFIDEDRLARIYYLSGDLEDTYGSPKRLDFSQNSIAKDFSELGSRSFNRRFQLDEIKLREFNNNFMLHQLYNEPVFLDYKRMDDPDYIMKFREDMKAFLERRMMDV